MAEQQDKRLESVRRFFATMCAADGGAMRDRLEQAFESVPREMFLGPGPWLARAFLAGTYIATPDADPIHVYQNLLFALDAEKHINNGEPALHGQMIGALDPDRGDTVLHIGCGTGYYTAILAQLVGPGGKVIAYDIEPALIRRAAICLAPWENVTVLEASGVADALPRASRIYVNAGATHPAAAWLDALATGGRLVFPLAGGGSGRWGVTLAVSRAAVGYGVRVVGRSGFIGCAGASDKAEAARVTAAFNSGALFRAQSLHRDDKPDASAVLAGNGWWLSSLPLAGGD